VEKRLEETPPSQFRLWGYTPVVPLFLVFSVNRVNKTFFFAIRFAIHVICATGFGELHYGIIDITEDEQLVHIR